jgi:hypothetical protein
MRAVALVALILGLTAPGANQTNARPAAPPPPIPPNLRAVSPRGVLSGHASYALGVLSTRGFQPNPYVQPSAPVVHWNALPLDTIHVQGDLYEAYVPANLISTAQTVSVTTRNDIGWSNVLTVVVTDSLEALPEPPAHVVFAAEPGLLGDDSLTNTLTLAMSDRLGSPVTSANVVFAASDGQLIATRELPDAAGEVTATLRYWPAATETVTPVLSITAFMLAPALYTSATITLTGVFTRSGTWMPFFPRAWPPTQPRPVNHTPCTAAALSPLEPMTVPADHVVDYYRIDSGFGLYFPPLATIALVETPQLLTLRLYHITGDDCDPGPGGTPTLTTTLIGEAMAAGPVEFGLGYVRSYCEYLLEVRNADPVTQRTYTVSHNVYGLLLSPLGCYGHGVPSQDASGE